MKVLKATNGCGIFFVFLCLDQCKPILKFKTIYFFILLPFFIYIQV